MFKRFLFFAIFLIPFICQAQLYGPFTGSAHTATMISSAADSTVGRIMEYESIDRWKGKATLWVGAYSNTDGLSATLYIYYRVYRGQNTNGKNIYSFWALADSVTSSDVMTATQYASDDWSGIEVNMAKFTDWQWHPAIQFKYKWTPSASDTIYIGSEYQPKENDR